MTTNNSLSDRQRALLKMVIEEYISSCELVSSGHLSKKYKLNISAATVRNEMAILIRRGFLEQPHVSAGRQPTPMGYRLYIQELMDNEDLPVLKEVAMKQNVWNNRYEIDKFLRSAALALADATGLLCIVSTTDGRVFSSGVVNILDHPEFFDIEVARSVLNMVDNFSLLQDILSKRNTVNICVIMGDEFERESLYPVSMVTKSYSSGGRKGYVTVLGPCRMSYKEVIPAVNYMTRVLEEVGVEW